MLVLIVSVGWGFVDYCVVCGGLIGGVLVWIYCLLFFLIGSEVGLVLVWFSYGWFDFDVLFGWWIGLLLVNGMLWSLGINVVLMMVLYVWEY